MKYLTSPYPVQGVNTRDRVGCADRVGGERRGEERRGEERRGEERRGEERRGEERRGEERVGQAVATTDRTIQGGGKRKERKGGIRSAGIAEGTNDENEG
eukprot:762612-Hanusia_phi.AAC.2